MLSRMCALPLRRTGSIPASGPAGNPKTSCAGKRRRGAGQGASLQGILFPHLGRKLGRLPAKCLPASRRSVLGFLFFFLVRRFDLEFRGNVASARSAWVTYFDALELACQVPTSGEKKGHRSGQRKPATENGAPGDTSPLGRRKGRRRK